MRLKDQKADTAEKYAIIIIDDDPGIIDTLKVIINKDRYTITGFTNPDDALKAMQSQRFDIMILDFLLEKVTGKEVVEAVRAFNNEIYIILLTGYKDMAPPIDALAEYDIQGYCEKGTRFDQLILQLESAVKSILLTRKLIRFHEGMRLIVGSVSEGNVFNPLNEVLLTILKQIVNITKGENGFFITCRGASIEHYNDIVFVKGIGRYDGDGKTLYDLIIERYSPFLEKVLCGKTMLEDQTMIFFSLTNEFNDETTALGIECRLDGEMKDIVKVFIANAQATYNNAILHSIINKKNSDLRSMVGQLEDSLARRTALEIELLQKQKMEVIGRLTGGIAHDFNNILLIISGYSDILLKKMDVNDPNRDRVSKIKMAGDRGAGLIKQLMAFSRKQNLNKVIYSVNDIISPLKDIVSVSLGNNITLTCYLYEHLWKTLIDKTQMEQVLMNLIVNARDAISGQGEITIFTKNIRSDTVQALKKPEMEVRDYIKLEITDTGSGISQEIMANIFEPFFTTKNRGQGTGLGLSTVYGLVKQMSGYIYVESILGKGATFTIYLPRVEGVHEDEKKTLSAPLEGTETILVVDDEEEIKSYVGSVLTNEGYRVLRSDSPQHAINIFRKNNVDLVLSDMIMPEMSGKKMVAKMMEINSNFKILFMSGYLNSELVEQGFYYSKRNFIEKPFSTENLLAKIREVFQYL